MAAQDGSILVGLLPPGQAHEVLIRALNRLKAVVAVTNAPDGVDGLLIFVTVGDPSRRSECVDLIRNYVVGDVAAWPAEAGSAAE